MWRLPRALYVLTIAILAMYQQVIAACNSAGCCESNLHQSVCTCANFPTLSICTLECFPPEQQKFPSILTPEPADLNTEVRYYAISGNADFIVAGGFMTSGAMRLPEDLSNGAVLTKINVASQHTEWIRSYDADGF